LSAAMSETAPADHNGASAPMGPRALVAVEGLAKTYDDGRGGEVVAVDDLSFEAHAGEVFGLLGPNGAGKTTALRVLTTMLRPTRGTATVNGFDCVEQAEMVRRQVGFISANTAIYDRMTAWEFVEYFGRLHGLGGDELRGRMEALFDRLQMQALRDTLGAKMSTGMRQKTSIARALVHDPPVIVFDEATNGLDAFAARASLDEVAKLRDAGKCIVFSTHIMSEVERICDRIAVMDRGHIVECGRLQELRDRHGEPDLEELFFRLIRSPAEYEAGASDPAGA